MHAAHDYGGYDSVNFALLAVPWCTVLGAVPVADVLAWAYKYDSVHAMLNDAATRTAQHAEAQRAEMHRELKQAAKLADEELVARIEKMQRSRRLRAISAA